MGRRIVVVRHGERVDHIFTDDWINQAFDADGHYTKFNLNMPDSIVKRSGMPESYLGDTPLTQVGQFQGQLLGKGLSEQGILRPSFLVYSSPALRSIQTTTAILKGMEQVSSASESTVPNSNSDSILPLIKVDPSLMEIMNFDWFRTRGVPKFMSVPELVLAGFPIDKEYKPLMEVNELSLSEEIENFYHRNFVFIKTLLDSDLAQDKDLLLVGHAVTLDSITRLLCGKESRSWEAALAVMRNVPYVGMAIAEEQEPDVDGQQQSSWSIISNGPLISCHSSVSILRANEMLTQDFESDCK